MPATHWNSKMKEFSASPLEYKRPKAVERNCGLSARAYINTMMDSAKAAIGGATIFHSLTARDLTRQFHVDRAPLLLPSLARQHEYGALGRRLRRGQQCYSGVINALRA